MKEFSWEREERLGRQKEKRDRKFLESQGWKVKKSDWGDWYAIHPNYGMMTVERALKGNYDTQTD